MKLLVCTAVYEAGRPFIPAWCDGLLAATARFDGALSVLLLSDGLHATPDAYASIADALPLDIAVAATGSSIASVRRQLLSRARERAVDGVVLFDMDDIPAPDSLSAHANALADAEISYGDVRIIAVDGTELSSSFFAGAGVPGAVSGPTALRFRNFIGFGNAALRKDAILPSALAIPEGLASPDWWFFTTLLHAGHTARRTQQHVAAYRQHPGNLLSGRASPAPQDVLARCRGVLAHCKQFLDEPQLTAYRAKLAELICALERGNGPTAKQLKAACHQPGVWHEDIWRLVGGL